MASRRTRKTPERRSSGLILDARTAAWLVRRFLHAAAAEARRTLRVWRSA
jgi:hypothetical protein